MWILHSRIALQAELSVLLYRALKGTCNVSVTKHAIQIGAPAAQTSALIPVSDLADRIGFDTHRATEKRGGVSASVRKWWPAGQCSKTAFSPIRTTTISSRTWNRTRRTPARDRWRRRPKRAAPSAPTRGVRQQTSSGPSTLNKPFPPVSWLEPWRKAAGSFSFLSAHYISRMR